MWPTPWKAHTFTDDAPPPPPRRPQPHHQEKNVPSLITMSIYNENDLNLMKKPMLTETESQKHHCTVPASVHPLNGNHLPPQLLTVVLGFCVYLDVGTWDIFSLVFNLVPGFVYCLMGSWLVCFLCCCCFFVICEFDNRFLHQGWA